MATDAGPIAARWWHGERSASGDPVARCELCFHGCTIVEGGTGLYCVRTFDAAGRLESPYLGRFAAVAVDPIEKKPLHHWRPGSRVLSLGSVGCNLFCPFCQNHALSNPAGDPRLQAIAPDELVRMTREAGLSAVTFTYNEPTLQAEYIFAAAPLLAASDIATVLVTNGMYGAVLREEIARWVSALNVDVKTFDPDAYRKLGGSLEVVKANVAHLVGSGLHVELTNLVVPGVSDDYDDFAAMVDWIAGLSKEIPLHISRYFPAYKYTAPPTNLALMKRFEDYAKGRLSHVHLGNV